MRCILAPCLVALAASSAFAVELAGPASVEAGSGELVRVTAADLQEPSIWELTPADYPHEIMRDEQGQRTGIVFPAPACESTLKEILVRVTCWDEQETFGHDDIDELVVLITGDTVIIDPDPTDKIKQDDAYVVIAYEADEQNPDDATRSAEFEAYLNQTFNGRWRLWDDDLSDQVLRESTAPQVVKDAYRVAQAASLAAGQPWCVITDGTNSVDFELPASTEAAIAMIEESTE